MQIVINEFCLEINTQGGKYFKVNLEKWENVFFDRAV